MIQILPQERWHELAEIFDREFEGSEMPHEERSWILADVDEETGEIKSFVVAEALIRLGLVYNTGTRTKEMFERVKASMPANVGVIIIADQQRYEQLAGLYKMRHVPGKIYRRDF